jgi:hypothetical protein
MQNKKLNWRNNTKELCLFFQMIGDHPNYKIQYFITKMKKEQKYTLKIVDGKTPIYYFEYVKEAQDFCQNHFDNLKTI